MASRAARPRAPSGSDVDERPPRERRRLSAAIAAAVAGAVLSGVVLTAALSADAGTPIDVAAARAKLAEFVAANGTLPPGSAVPPSGPPCPLSTVDQLRQAAQTIGAVMPADVD